MLLMCYYAFRLFAHLLIICLGSFSLGTLFDLDTLLFSSFFLFLSLSFVPVSSATC